MFKLSILILILEKSSLIIKIHFMHLNHRFYKLFRFNLFRLNLLIIESVVL